MATRVAERRMRWMRRRKRVDERPLEERSNEAPELSPLQASMQLSRFGGTFLRLGDDGVPVAARRRDFEPFAAVAEEFGRRAGALLGASDAAVIATIRAGSMLLQAGAPPSVLEAEEEARREIETAKRLGFAEALRASGALGEAREAIEELRDFHLMRAGKMADPEVCRRYLEDVAEHARALELAREWLSA